MKPDDIDRILNKAAGAADSSDSGRRTIERAQRAVMVDLHPVRPLAPMWAITLVFLSLSIALAAVAGTVLGLSGVSALNQSQRALIFPTLLVIAWLASVACSREMRPAAGSKLGTPVLALATVGLPLLFAIVFQGYDFRGFIAEGTPCLLAGMIVSIPTAILLAYILRRGFVMDWGMAGVAAGTLAGLTGLGMLELHCHNLKAIHVITWHVAVVVLSGVCGFGIGRAADVMRRKKTF